MSQELIGIIGAAIVAMALAVPVHAQVDCADWNTADYFKVAEVSDVTRCLQAGVDLKALDNDGKLSFDYARDNEHLKGTNAYWKLIDARFQ